MAFSKLKAWKIEWTKNASAENGAQAYCIGNMKDGEFCILSHTNKNGRMWTNVAPDVLVNLISKNCGVFEVITPSQKRKVYFDIDSEPAKSDLAKVKEIIKERFPDAQMAISGSKTPKKDSYHIILTNYFFENQQAQRALMHWISTLPSDLGFDNKVYTTNRNFKCINQSKLDGRVQKYISGSKDLKAHLVLYGFDDDAIDASTLEWNKTLLQSMTNEEKNTIDILCIPQQNCQLPDFSWNKSTPETKLRALPCGLRGSDGCLPYHMIVMVMCWFKQNGGEFNNFWEWCANKENTNERRAKYQNLWNTKEYKYSDETLFSLFKRFYPYIQKEDSSDRDKFMKESMVEPTSKTQGKYLAGTDILKGFEKSSLLYVVLPMGRNKTGGTVDWILTLPKTVSVLWLSTRITYAKNVAGRLKEVGFVEYGECKKDTYHEQKRLIMSPQSIYKTKTKMYDIVILDEVECIKDCWSSSGTHTVNTKYAIKEHLTDNWKRYVDVIRGAKKVLLMDAFPTQTTITFHTHLTGSPCEVLGSDYPADTRIVKEFVGGKNEKDNVNRWKCSIIDKINAGKKVYIFYPWVRDQTERIGVVSLASSIARATNTPESMYRCYFGQQSEETKASLINVNDEWSKCKFVITTNTITVGVNYDVKNHFDEIYVYYSSFNKPREVVQCMGRIRDIIPLNIVYVHSGAVPAYQEPEIFKENALYRNLLTGYRYEYYSRGKKIFKELAKLGGYAFETSTDELNKLTFDKMCKIEKDTECLFMWNKISDIDPFSEEFEVLKDLMRQQRATFSDKLSYSKGVFRMKFDPETPDEVLEYIWDSRNLNTVDVLRQIETGSIPFLKHIFGKEYNLPQVPEYNIPQNVYNNFMDRVQLRTITDKTKLTNRLLGQVLHSVFGKPIWEPVKQQDGKRTQKCIDGTNVQEYELNNKFRVVVDAFLKYSAEIPINCSDEDYEGCLIDDDSVEYSTDF